MKIQEKIPQHENGDIFIAEKYFDTNYTNLRITQIYEKKSPHNNA